MNGLKKEYGQRITFLQVNVLNPDNVPIMEQYGFGSTPEIYLVDEEDRVIGYWDEIESAEPLKQRFDEVLGEGGG